MDIVPFLMAWTVRHGADALGSDKKVHQVHLDMKFNAIQPS